MTTAVVTIFLELVVTVVLVPVVMVVVVVVVMVVILVAVVPHILVAVAAAVDLCILVDFGPQRTFAEVGVFAGAQSTGITVVGSSTCY